MAAWTDRLATVRRAMAQLATVRRAMAQLATVRRAMARLATVRRAMARLVTVRRAMARLAAQQVAARLTGRCPAPTRSRVPRQARVLQRGSKRLSAKSFSALDRSFRTLRAVPEPGPFMAGHRRQAIAGSQPCSGQPFYPLLYDQHPDHRCKQQRCRHDKSRQRTPLSFIVWVAISSWVGCVFRSYQTIRFREVRRQSMR